MKGKQSDRVPATDAAHRLALDRGQRRDGEPEPALPAQSQRGVERPA
jgi:hypothetical protein